MGISHKTDGKSSSSSNSTTSSSSGETISEKFTQRPSDEDNYSTTDKTGTVEYQKETDSSHFKFLGMAIVIIIGLIWMNSNTQIILDYERDKVFQEQAEAAARMQEERIREAQNNAIIRKSQDILNENPLRSA